MRFDHDSADDRFVADAVAVEAEVPDPARPRKTRSPFTRIGPGRPLSIRIVSVFPGERDGGRGKQAILTSAVKNPLLGDAQPLAINYLYDNVAFGAPLGRRADLPGSQVVYYSPAELRSSLDITLRFAFDAFDKDTYDAWLEAAADVATLPAFAVAGPVGAGGVALAKRVGKLLLGLADRLIDGSNDSLMSWTLNLDEPGFDRAQAGFVVFYPDAGSADERLMPLGPGGVDTPESGTYVVRDGTLRWAQKPTEVVRTGRPYVLLSIDGKEIPELADWAPTAVSAVLASKFLNTPGSGSDDALEAFRLFNDMMFTRQYQEVATELATFDKLTQSEKARPQIKARIKDLQAKRDSLLKNIQDDTVKELLTAR